jgi:S1-C subfamily serine protease
VSRPRGAAAAAALALALWLAGCGGTSVPLGSERAGAPAQAGPPATTRVEVVEHLAAQRFDASAVYAREAPGVVTVISVFAGGSSVPAGGEEGLGSGFVLDGDGRIATNAHVVTTGSGARLHRAKSVYVQFGDGNQVPAQIVGADPDADVALLKVDPGGLALRPLPLGTSEGLTVGAPVAAIGSPFGEPQSLSVGVISATNRSIESLNSGAAGSGDTFAISGAIQTDAAINHGNSGGPLVDARGDVIGINAQIQSTGGGGEGVGFAIPIDAVRRSLDQLRLHGSVAYAYLGVSTVAIFPQLARAFGLPVQHGALVEAVSPGSPAARVGLRAGTRRDVAFQASHYTLGGDLIVTIDGHPVTRAEDLSLAIAPLGPGQTVRLGVWRDGTPRTIAVTLGQRPE